MLGLTWVRRNATVSIDRPITCGLRGANRHANKMHVRHEAPTSYGIAAHISRWPIEDVSSMDGKRASAYRRSPSSWRSAVDPSMSAKRKVTLPVGKLAMGTASWRHEWGR